MSYKAWMTFRNEKPATNGLAFATAEEAEAFANDLLCRWMLPTGFEVREADEPVSHRWDPEKGLSRIEAPEEAHFPAAQVRV